MKKFFAILFAAMLVVSLSVTAFAVAYDFEDGVVPVEWEQHWGAKQFAIVDGALFVERVTDNNSYFSAGFNAGEFKAGVTYCVSADIWFEDAEYGATPLWIGLVQDNFDGTVYGSAEQNLSAGEVATLTFYVTPEADLTNVWFSSKQNTWNPQGVSYYLDNVSITEGAEAPVEETPVVEEPVEETPVEETPVEETPVESEPAETGLTLAVVPMIVAAAVVALSKKR